MIKSQWQKALDQTADRLRNELRLVEPPFDALRAIRMLGIRLAFDQAQSTRGRRKVLAGQQAIFLRPEERPERLQWAAAHELGEVCAFQVFEAADWTGTDIPVRLREQVANLFAARFLLPTAEFAADCRTSDFDLPRLKEIYSTASHELIARRMLDLRPDAILTIFDQGRCTARFNGFDQRVGRLLQTEQSCWELSARDGTPLVLEQDGVTIRVWPIHEPGWRRELMLTVPQMDGDEWQSVGEPVTEAVG